MSIRRQNIVDAMVTRFSVIRVSNGYHTDAGLNCSTWFHDPNTTYDLNELPMINVRDIQDAIVMYDVAGYSLHTLTVEIHTAHLGAVHDSGVRQAIYDIYKAIGVDPSWGGIAIDTLPEASDDLRVDHGDQIVSHAVLTVKVQFTTTLWGE